MIGCTEVLVITVTKLMLNNCHGDGDWNQHSALHSTGGSIVFMISDCAANERTDQFRPGPVNRHRRHTSRLWYWYRRGFRGASWSMEEYDGQMDPTLLLVASKVTLKSSRPPQYSYPCALIQIIYFCNFAILRFCDFII
jgi:hypothetical protein